MKWERAVDIKAILFDLDDTLIVDEAVSKEAMRETAQFAAKHHGVEVGQFLSDAAATGLALWLAGPLHSFCDGLGISFDECLWGRFEGNAPGIVELRAWSLGYRQAVFDAVLRKQDITGEEGAEELANVFSASRRKLQRLMPDAVETLARLKPLFQIALLTNGAPDLQREKIATSGLGGFFDTIVVSGEQGTGKPQAKIFHHTLEKLGTPPASAVMVGNSLTRDIAGAKNAGLAAAVWLQVPGSEEFADVTPDHTITGLHALPPLLQRLLASAE